VAASDASAKSIVNAQQNFVNEEEQVLPENSGEGLSASVDKEPELKPKEKFTSEKRSSGNSREIYHHTEKKVIPKRTADNNSIDNRNVTRERSSDPSDSDLLLILLCLILPPLAVYLYFDAVNTTFWISLILTLLFWIPGIIFAFLVCFAGVEL
jgi:uncharacterized membrane protein YqaE (UPF0057 family)